MEKSVKQKNQLNGKIWLNRKIGSMEKLVKMVKNQLNRKIG